MNKRPGVSAATKLKVLVRWGSVICAKCRVSTCVDLVEYDHINPWELSRDNSPSNLQPLCEVCHYLKTNGPKHLKVDGDKSKIAKAKRLAAGGKKRKGPPIPAKKDHKWASRKMESHINGWGKR